MSDPTGQPTEEEIEAYYAQLREAPLHELLIQAIGMLAGGAEAKLGRPDARVLIDAMGALVQIGGGQLGEAEGQLQSAVAQLQMAQVQVEKQATGAGETGQAAEAPEGPPPAAPPPGPQAAAPPSAAAPRTAEDPKQTDKLWIPGR